MRTRQTMTARLHHRVRSTLQPGDHPYLDGAWAPVFEEWTDDDCPVTGQIPSDLDGVYLRNTPNPVHQPLGMYHPFDGDGMLCAMRLRHGRASFRNRFVRTRGFVTEQEAGRALWSGIAQTPSLSERPGWGAQGWLKDASSTGVCMHGGRALTSFHPGGELYVSDPVTLDSYGAVGWGGEFPREGICAHSQVDPATGELLWFSSSHEAPYMRCGAVSRLGDPLESIDVALPGPRLPHAMMATRRFYVLNDFPLFRDDDGTPRLHDLPSRFALVPRHGRPGGIRWFESGPTYVLNWVNAREDGDQVILDGYRQQDPAPPPLDGAPQRYAQMMARLDLHSIRPQLWRWRFDLRSGQARDEMLDDAVCEFGTINRALQGQAQRYVYSLTARPGWFLFDGFVKQDLARGTRQVVRFGEGVFGSQMPFVARAGARDEDDGWLLTYVTDTRHNRSECWLYAAQNPEAGPVARVRLPLRIPPGTHACWADVSELS